MVVAMMLMLVLCAGLLPGASAETAARVTGVKVLVNGVEQPEGTIHYDDDDEYSEEKNVTEQLISIVSSEESIRILGQNEQVNVFKPGDICIDNCINTSTSTCTS